MVRAVRGPQGDYQLRSLRLQRSLAGKRALLGLLLDKGSACLVLDRLRREEGRKLQVLPCGLDTQKGCVRQVAVEVADNEYSDTARR